MNTSLSPLYTKLDLNKYKGLGVLGLRSVYDLLYYFPRSYDNRSSVKQIKDLIADDYVILHVKLLQVYTLPIRKGKRMVKATATDGTGLLELVWFSMPYLQKSLKLQEEYIVVGTVKRNLPSFQMVNPEFRLSKGQAYEGEILPIYSTHKNLPQNRIRKYIKEILTDSQNSILENIPKNICEKYAIVNRVQALWNIHFPKNTKEIEEAKRRFAIEELLILEMGILKSRFQLEQENQALYQLDDKKDLVKAFLTLFPFSLTRAQKKVIIEVYQEFLQGRIVNRLVQGDVGSGKTMVAMVLLLYMIENSYQGVFMAPTEILALQHYLSVVEKFQSLGLRVEVLSSSVRGKKRKNILADLVEGKIHLLIGTHALLEDEVQFHKLGLIVIDEQHRFGVVQRKRLRDKGILANLLVMTATPIPRSLALSIYGDLDVSILDELPPGRNPIKTKWIQNTSDEKKMYAFIQKKLEQGKQAYFVAPLIEESESLNLSSLASLEENLRNTFPDFSLALLHGKMSSKEKDALMQDFKENRIQILLSTTVIEVGIDVPNAVIMTIFSAERFGLSALHQLRGRVGRGRDASYCFLISKTKNDTSAKRLSILEQTQDGFLIAEEDLKIRNAGEIFGLRQSGFSDLKFIDLIHDVKTIKMVRDECLDYLRKHKGTIENPSLEEEIAQKFQNSTPKN